MRHFVRTSLGMLALGLIAPQASSAQYATASTPAGYQPAAAVAPASPMAVGPDGRPMTAPAPAPVAAAEPAPHKHKRGTVCAACAAKMGYGRPPGKIVGCAHSKNGVCGPCQAALNMPGPFVQAGAPTSAAPGQAMVANGASARVGGYDESMGDPAPVGVVQAGYSQSAGMMPMQAPMAASMQPAAPGRAVAESSPGREFYQKKSDGFPRPHILGHLFGWSGIGSEKREERAFKKAEAHAMLTYDPNAPTGVDELPASKVFGKQK